MERIIFTLFFFFGFHALYAQSDAEQKTTYSQEECQLTTSELQRFICYVTRANVEEKTLVKIGIRPNSVAPYYQDSRNFQAALNLEMLVEHKIHPSFSLLVGLDYAPSYVTFRRFTANATRIGNNFSHDVEARLGTRYYYAMSRRIRKGQSANNFSGNYIGLQFSRPILRQIYTHDYDFQTGAASNSQYKSRLFQLDQPSLEITWGLQRRLGRLGYIDVSTGPRITHMLADPFPPYKRSVSVSFKFNVLVGIGW